MNQEIRNYVMQKMSPFLDNGQTLRLERILEEVQLKQENGNGSLKKLKEKSKNIWRQMKMKIHHTNSHGMQQKWSQEGNS